MRAPYLAIAALATAFGAGAASAHPHDRYSDGRHYQRAVYDVQRQCDRELRRADSRQEYNWIVRECRQEIRELNRRYQEELRHQHRDGRDHDRRWDRDWDDDRDDDDDD